ncbi:MAG: hypothetical protein IJU75_01020 [Clostridia bacterium]|nr:hypothetical protein [Clostridia bacterium]
MIIEVAERYFEIEPKYPGTELEYSFYSAKKTPVSPVKIAVDDADVLYGMTLAGRDPTPADGEIVAFRQKIADLMPTCGRCLVHGGALELKKSGKCILFMADSGVGKTTQLINLTREFPSETRIINGDKPVIGLKDGVPYVFPSPWNGKEGIRSSHGAPLGMIVFLEQAGCDEISDVAHGEKVLRIFHQIFVGEKIRDNYLRITPFIDMLDSVPAVILRNRGGRESARLLREYADRILGTEDVK